MKNIPLTQGKFAIVDDGDYDWLNQWKWYARKCGKEKWYAVRKQTINGKEYTIYLHRFIMNVPPGLEVDHINGNSLDDRHNNLRICRGQANKWNTQKQKRDKSSKYKGVCWHKTNKKWWAYIHLNGNRKHLGFFDNEDDAGEAYNQGALELFGVFAQLNDI